VGADSHEDSIGWNKGQATPNNCAVFNRVYEEMWHGVAQLEAPFFRKSGLALASPAGAACVSKGHSR